MHRINWMGNGMRAGEWDGITFQLPVLSLADLATSLAKFQLPFHSIDWILYFDAFGKCRRHRHDVINVNVGVCVPEETISRLFESFRLRHTTSIRLHVFSNYFSGNWPRFGRFSEAYNNLNVTWNTFLSKEHHKHHQSQAPPSLNCYSVRYFSNQSMHTLVFRMYTVCYTQTQTHIMMSTPLRTRNLRRNFRKKGTQVVTIVDLASWQR